MLHFFAYGKLFSFGIRIPLNPPHVVGSERRGRDTQAARWLRVALDFLDMHTKSV